MKKITFILFILITWILYVPHLQAQSSLLVGVKGGMDGGSAYLDRTFDRYPSNMRIVEGFHGGFFMKYYGRYTDKFLNAALQVGVNYIQKGYAQELPELNDYRFETEMDYIEVPFEAILYAGKKKIHYFITLGGYLEMLMAVRQNEIPDLEDVILISAFHPYDVDRDNDFGYGARGSVGVQVQLPIGYIHLEGFFTFSFSNIINYGTFDSGLPDLSSLYAFGGSVGYFIPLSFGGKTIETP